MPLNPNHPSIHLLPASARIIISCGVQSLGEVCSTDCLNQTCSIVYSEKAISPHRTAVMSVFTVIFLGLLGLGLNATFSGLDLDSLALGLVSF